MCFKHSELLKRAREASIAMQTLENHLVGGNSSSSGGLQFRASRTGGDQEEEREKMQIVETIESLDPKLIKAEEFTILPGKKGVDGVYTGNSSF